MNSHFSPIITFILGIVLIASSAFSDPLVSQQPISFSKGASFNDIFVTSKIIEILQQNNIPHFVSNEGVIYVEEKNESIINTDNPTKGLGLIQFSELSRATIYMALLSAKGIEYIPSKSGDNKYFNVYYHIEDNEEINKEVQPLYIETLSSGVLINIKEK